MGGQTLKVGVFLFEMEKKIEKEEIEILDCEEITKNEVGGIFIPIDIIIDERLNLKEAVLLSFYRKWTNSELHCCCINDKCIMDELHISQKTFYRMKKHLRELDLIKCDGKKTIYTKSSHDTHNR